MRREVDRGHHLRARVAHRRGHRAQALLELLVDDRPALVADAAQLGAQRRRRRDRARREPLELGLLEVGVELGLGQPGQEHAAHRRGVGGEAGADIDGDGHDARDRHAGDVDDVRAVEHGQRGGLAHLGHERLEVGLGHLGQAQAGQIGVAELEHARAEAEVAGVGAHVAEVDQREQEAARGGAAHARAAGDVGERELARVGVEGPDDLQAPLQRLDEVAHPSSSSVRCAIANAALAAGTPA